MSCKNVATSEVGCIKNYRAPVLIIDQDTHDHTLVFGNTKVSGAAIMVEIVSKGRVVGLICASLIGRKEIYPHHIAHRQA